MKINCQFPSIIRNPEFNKLVSTGFIHIYLKDKLLTILTPKDVNLALADDYVKVEQLKINLGYALIDKLHNTFKLPEEVRDVYKYTVVNGIITKTYSDIFMKYVKPYRDQYKRLYSISYDEVDNYRLVNPDTGEYAQVFVLVDCCHCVLCQEKKRNRLSSRVVLESLNHVGAPLFVALTYATPHYPKDYTNPEVHTDEIQKFNKRLRKSLEQYGVKYKYLFVSEYGSERGRLHYHALFFGLNTPELMQLVRNDFMEYDNQYLNEVYLITKLIYKAWNKGIVNVQEAIDISGKYVSKYIGKSSSGKQTKSLKSIKMGNHFFTPEKIEELRRNVTKNSFYVLIDNKLREIPTYSWIQSKVYPSLARQLDREFRTTLLVTYENMNYYGLQYTALYKEFMNKYNKFLVLLGFTDYSLNCCYHKPTEKLLIAIKYNINKLNTYDYDIEEVIRINDLRNKHILLSNIIEYDVDYNAYIQKIRLSNIHETDCQ